MMHQESFDNQIVALIIIIELKRQVPPWRPLVVVIVEIVYLILQYAIGS